MKLEKLSFKGLTRYEEGGVDFAALGEGLIAIAGKNGEGKTSLLEAPFASLHLELPTRPGNLADSMHGKDARLELTFENGSQYRALIAVDAIGRSTEAYLFEGAGNPVTSGKVREFSAEIERRFGSASLFLSACLSAQNKAGSFLFLEKKARKDLLAEILDTGGLQALCEAARKRIAEAEKKLENVRGKIAALESQLASVPAMDLNAMRQAHEAAKAVLTKAQEDIERQREAYRKLSIELSAAQERAKGRMQKERDLAEASTRIQETAAKLGGLDDELGRLKGRISNAQEQAKTEASRAQEYRDAEAKLKEVRDNRATIAQAMLDAETNLRALSDRRMEIREEALTCDRLKADLKRAEIEAGLLGNVPCHGEGSFAGCGFLQKAGEARANIPEISAQISAAERKAEPLQSIEHQLAEAQPLVDAKRRELQALTSEIETLQAAANRVQLAKAAEDRIAELERELMEGEGGIARRRGEYNRSLAQDHEKKRTLEQELSACPREEVDQLQVKLNAAATAGRIQADAVSKLEEKLRDFIADIAKAEAVEKAAIEAKVLLEMQRQGAEDLARDLGEWSILERALGRDGIQALEIDAAGPELSSLTNELLTSCFGPRFEVRFVTQAPKADGGVKEVFDVQVIDHDRGREGAVDSLSGGEKTIVSESISLALAIYVGKHSGRRFETLFRDETAGALDPDNAARYVRMLRQARQVGGFFQIIYIAQQPEVYEAADAVLWCEGGRVERMEGGAA